MQNRLQLTWTNLPVASVLLQEALTSQPLQAENIIIVVVAIVVVIAVVLVIVIIIKIINHIHHKYIYKGFKVILKTRRHLHPPSQFKNNLKNHHKKLYCIYKMYFSKP